MAQVICHNNKSVAEMCRFCSIDIVLIFTRRAKTKQLWFAWLLFRYLQTICMEITRYKKYDVSHYQAQNKTEGQPR